MFFGSDSYMSLLAMMQRQREEEERRKQLAKLSQPKFDDDDYGFLMPRTHNGMQVDPMISKQARARALIAFGLPLLQHASDGDWGSALAEGAAGFTGTMDDTLERYRQQRLEEDKRDYERNRAAKQDDREERMTEAQIKNIEDDNAARAEKAKLEAEAAANRRKYHQQLLADVSDPAKRRTLEPFVGEANFEEKLFQLTAPQDADEKIRLDMAIAASNRAADASNRAVETIEYNRQRDIQQDTARAQRDWDGQLESEAKLIADAYITARDQATGQLGPNGRTPPMTPQERLSIIEMARLQARQKVEGRLGPRPGGILPAPAQVRPPGVYDYDPTTGGIR